MTAASHDSLSDSELRRRLTQRGFSDAHADHLVTHRDDDQIHADIDRILKGEQT